MGAEGSKIQGSLLIHLTRAIILAGDSLEGQIIIDAFTKMPPCNLTLTVIGLEIGKFKE